MIIGARLYCSDGSHVGVAGGGGIQFEPDKVYLIESGVSGLTPTESAALTAIPTNPVLTNDARLDNLDAAISSRLATASYTPPNNTAVLNAIAALNNLSLAELNNLSALEVQSMIDGITEPDNTGIASTLLAVNNLNDLSTAQIQAALDALPAEILAQAQTTPIHADAKKLNGANVQGTGTELDKWRG